MKPRPIKIDGDVAYITLTQGYTAVIDAADVPPGLAPHEQAMHLFAAMIRLMDECDAGIANLTPFRGPSMDVGTAFELGYLYGNAKPVFGYSNDPRDYAERVTDASLGSRLLEAGVLDKAQLDRGTVRVGDIEHLGRLFDRDPSVDRDAVVVVAEAASAGFKELSRRKVLDGGICWTVPVLSDGVIYARNHAGELVALDHRARQLQPRGLIGVQAAGALERLLDGLVAVGVAAAHAGRDAALHA